MTVVGKRGYKETSIGWIPSDWQIRTVGEICEVKGGKRLPKGEMLTEEDTGFPYIRVTNMRMGGVNTDGILFVPAHVQPSISQYTISKDDIFISVAGSLGIVGVIPECLDGANLTENADKLTNIKICRDYLCCVLRSDQIQSVIQREGTTSAQPKLALGRIREFVIPVPPKVEQRKIAAILMAVDDKLDIITRQIEATHNLKVGLMQTLFSRGVGTQDADGRWVPHAEFKDSELGKIPVGWAVKSLADMTQENRARNAGILDDALLCGVLKDQGLVPMRERVKGATTERCRIVEPNTFAYNPMRINIGSIARNRRDYPVMVSPDYVVFSAKAGELMYSYLDHFRRSDEWQRFVGRSGDGGVRIRIYYDDLAQLRMRVPPLEEQARIVAILDSVSEKVNCLITKERELQTLKRGLMQKLLTGEWRVAVDMHQALALAA